MKMESSDDSGDDMFAAVDHVLEWRTAVLTEKGSDVPRRIN